MVFGEIVEPTSRALCEDDFVEYPTDPRPPLEWKQPVEVPKAIEVLLVGETEKVTKLLLKSLPDVTGPIAELAQSYLHIYRFNVNSYLAVYKASEQVCVGEVTEILIPWITTAKNVFALTSSPLSLLQNCEDVSQKSVCVLRSLLHRKEHNSDLYPPLETPNLVTGLGANVLSYCIHIDIPGSLFVAYIDSTPLDSLNTKPIIDLLNRLGVGQVKSYTLDSTVMASNNLYL